MKNVWFHTVLAGALAAGLAVPLVVQRHAVAQLRTETRELRRQCADLPRLHRENGRPTIATEVQRAAGERRHAELTRLLVERSALRHKLAEAELKLAAIAAQNREWMDAAMPVVAPAPGMTPPDALDNAGRSSPASALRTLAWANHRRDAATVADCIALAPEEQDSMEELFAGMDDVTRARLGSPERLAAILLVLSWNRTALAPGRMPMRIVGEATGPAGEARVSMRLQLSNQQIRDMAYRLREFPDGWRIIVPPGEVDLMVTSLANLPPSQWEYLGR